MLTLVVGTLLALGIFTIPVATAQETPKEICDNKIDDDKDTLVDCEDPDCPPCEPKKEICDNNIDDDGDTYIDCKDPDCPPCEKEGTPCSPGYWKAWKHRAEFDATCVQVSGWTCEELFDAITCRGSDASCRRQEAAAALNAINDCTE
jgi:hypothetical protein